MLKRSFDVLASFLALLVFWPLLLALAIWVFFDLGSPVLFAQVRPGKDGKSFKLLKFRSMRDAVDRNGNQLPDEQRLTKFGKKLRASSLDELPSLWNILRGHMSVVGPRPLLVEYLPLYNDRQKMRHDVRPGLTGWAQVNGRNAISWEEKFELDVWYVENQSFMLDMKIVVMTVLKVIRRSDINQDGEVTMSKFTGTPDE